MPSELVGEGGSAAANPNLGAKIMKNLAGGGKDRERPREKVEKRLTEVSTRTGLLKYTLSALGNPIGGLFTCSELDVQCMQ